MKKYLGITIVIASLALTIILWLQAKYNIGFFPPFLIAATQIIALLGAVMLAFEYVLASRLRIVETLFNGLDKVYQLHRTLGGMAFILILTHPLLLIINSVPSFSLFKMYIFPSANIAYTFGVLALYFYTIVLLITFYLKLPYKLWAAIHKFMSIPLLLSFLHVLLISSDVSSYLPLKLWIWLLFILAITAALYKRFLYRYLSPKYRYEITSINLKGDVIEIYMEPEKESLTFLPGQFVYARFINKMLGSEMHPFSISSGMGHREIRLSIKMDGDYTKKLVNLNLGDTCELRGPHGRFGESLLSDNKDLIWIAGGIGITPFLSMLDYEPVLHSQRRLSIYYVSKNIENAVYLPELLQKSLMSVNLKLFPHMSESNSRLSAKDVAEKEEFRRRDMRRIKVFLCGPTQMMESFARDLVDFGIKPWNIIKEDFSVL